MEGNRPTVLSSAIIILHILGVAVKDFKNSREKTKPDRRYDTSKFQDSRQSFEGRNLKSV